MATFEVRVTVGVGQRTGGVFHPNPVGLYTALPKMGDEFVRADTALVHRDSREVESRVALQEGGDVLKHPYSVAAAKVGAPRPHANQCRQSAGTRTVCASSAASHTVVTRHLGFGGSH